jgi:hypothetical protein
MDRAAAQAEETIKADNDREAKLFQRLNRLEWLCGGLAVCLTLDAVAHVIEAVKK